MFPEVNIFLHRVSEQEHPLYKEAITMTKKCDICEQELAPIFEGQEKHDVCQSCQNEAD